MKEDTMPHTPIRIGTPEDVPPPVGYFGPDSGIRDTPEPPAEPEPPQDAA